MGVGSLASPTTIPRILRGWSTSTPKMGEEEGEKKPRVLQMFKGAIQMNLHRWCNCWCNCVECHKDAVKRICGTRRVRAEGSDKSCVTFVLHNEDHTLGNSLRYMIMKDPEVEFCGYSVTHPSESKINFRIQTRGGIPAVETFQKGLEELLGVCEHVLSKFEASVEQYKGQMDINME